MDQPRPVTVPRTWLRRLLALLVVASVATGCATGGAPRSAPPGPAPSGSPGPNAGSTAPVSIPLTAIRLTGDPRLLVDVEIGGATLKVLLDTGSVGLRLRADRVPPGAAPPEGPAPPVVFGGARRATGQLAHAPVRIGGIATTGPLPLELVGGVSCVPGAPRCGTAAGAPTFGGGTDGVLGISPLASGTFSDPLAALPGGTAAVVHFDPAGPSSLRLGVPPDGYVLHHLTAAPGRPGTPGWRPEVPACFTATALPGGRVCGPVLFDTGTPRVVVRVPGAADHPLPPGSRVDLALADSRWSVDLTTGPGRAARVEGTPVDGTRAGGAGPGGDRSIAGLPLFAGTDVRFDLAAGTIGFRAR